MSVNREPNIGHPTNPNFAKQLRDELRSHAAALHNLQAYAPGSIANSRDRGMPLPEAGLFIGQSLWNYETDKPCWWTGTEWVTVATVAV